MSNVNYATCTESTRYKGFYIDKNINSNFNSVYYSVVNPNKETYIHNKSHKVHVHADRESAAKQIVDCYYAQNKNKYSRIVRNKAMSLSGTRVLY